MAGARCDGKTAQGHACRRALGAALPARQHPERPGQGHQRAARRVPRRDLEAAAGRLPGLRARPALSALHGGGRALEEQRGEGDLAADEEPHRLRARRNQAAAGLRGVGRGPDAPRARQQRRAARQGARARLAPAGGRVEAAGRARRVASPDPRRVLPRPAELRGRQARVPDDPQQPGLRQDQGGAQGDVPLDRPDDRHRQRLRRGVDPRILALAARRGDPGAGPLLPRAHRLRPQGLRGVPQAAQGGVLDRLHPHRRPLPGGPLEARDRQRGGRHRRAHRQPLRPHDDPPRPAAGDHGAGPQPLRRRRRRVDPGGDHHQAGRRPREDLPLPDPARPDALPRRHRREARRGSGIQPDARGDRRRHGDVHDRAGVPEGSRSAGHRVEGAQGGGRRAARDRRGFAARRGGRDREGARADGRLRRRVARARAFAPSRQPALHRGDGQGSLAQGRGRGDGVALDDLRRPARRGQAQGGAPLQRHLPRRGADLAAAAARARLRHRDRLQPRRPHQHPPRRRLEVARRRQARQVGRGGHDGVPRVLEHCLQNREP